MVSHGTVLIVSAFCVWVGRAALGFRLFLGVLKLWVCEVKSSKPLSLNKYILVLFLRFV